MIMLIFCTYFEYIMYSNLEMYDAPVVMHCFCKESHVRNRLNGIKCTKLLLLTMQ